MPLLESTSATGLRVASGQDPTEDPKRGDPNRSGGTEETDRDRGAGGHEEGERTERYGTVTCRG